MTGNNQFFPNSTPLNFMSEDWQTWHQRVCQVLEIRADMPLEWQPLPRPWFLIPNQNELSEEQAEDLLNTVQSFLLGGRPGSLGHVKNRLLSLRYDATLPFLYAMRYVAFRDAKRRYYWPAFANLVLNDHFEPNLVAIVLASTTSTLWLRLYEGTKGALYFPREGLRHIKWPIAHAGLLPEDKEVLREFGLTLLNIGTDLYFDVCSLEIDEFILSFRDWLNNNQEYTYSRFSQLVDSARGEREVIAELGQQWLGFYRQELEEQHQTHSTHCKSVPSTRKRLIYDMRRNQLGLSLSLSRITGAQIAKLQWNNQTIDFKSQYDPDTDERVFLEAFFPLQEPVWPDKAILHVGSKLHEVNIPTLERNKSVVFEPSSGVQTKKWELGQEYILLIPGRLFKSTAASRIFAVWSEIGTPRGKWHDYSLIWARNCDPFVKGVSHGEGEITNQLAILEQSVEEMGLPSFGHQYRVRMSLVGGELIDIAANDIPVFSTARPPYLEIRGIWNEYITVTLLRRDEASGEYTTVNTLIVDQGWSSRSCIVELWENHAREGQYRLVLNQHQVDFFVASKVKIEDRQSVSRLRVEAFFEDNSGHRVANPSRYDLESLALHVNAWQQADLTLEVFGGEVHSARYYPFQTDDNGQWAESVENIPFELSSFPGGPIHFRIGWRGVFSQELVLPDRDHIKLDEFRLLTRQKSPDSSFNVHYQGTIRSNKVPGNLQGFLLAAPPWHDFPHVFDIQVSQNSTFRGITSVDWCPSWVIIATTEEISGPDRNPLIAVRRTDTPRRYPSSPRPIRAHNAFFEFAQIAERISEIPHPPELDAYLAVVPTIEYLREAFEILDSAQTWQFFSEWADLQLLADHFVPGDVVSLFGGKPGDSNLVGNVADVVIFDFSRASRARFLYFRYESQNTLSGRLKKSLLPRDKHIILESFDTLWCCPKCRLILPTRFQYNHLATHVASGDVMESQTEPTMFHPGTKFPGVSIGVTKTHGDDFRRTRNQLKRVLHREKEFEPEFVDWLKRFSRFVPPQIDRESWLRGIVEVMDQTWNIFQRRNLQEQDLERISHYLADHREALGEILRRTRGIHE